MYHVSTKASASVLWNRIVYNHSKTVLAENPGDSDLKLSCVSRNNGNSYCVAGWDVAQEMERN